MMTYNIYDIYQIIPKLCSNNRLFSRIHGLVEVSALGSDGMALLRAAFKWFGSPPGVCHPPWQAGWDVSSYGHGRGAKHISSICLDHIC